jgi:hypothetical protein
VLERRDLSPREAALWELVDATHERDETRRRERVLRAAGVLTPDEIYLASTVMALFNFYNTWVDVNGVDQLTADGYDATGVRLSSQGYAPPARPVAANP